MSYLMRYIAPPKKTNINNIWAWGVYSQVICLVCPNSYVLSLALQNTPIKCYMPIVPGKCKIKLYIQCNAYLIKSKQCIQNVLFKCFIYLGDDIYDFFSLFLVCASSRRNQFFLPSTVWSWGKNNTVRLDSRRLYLFYLRQDLM